MTAEEPSLESRLNDAYYERDCLRDEVQSLRAAPGEDDSFVVAKLHKHLKEQLASATRESEYGDGKRDALLDALAYLDGLSGGRYPSGGAR